MPLPLIAIAVDCHFDDLFFDIGLVSIVGIFGVKCCVRTFAVMTFVALFAIGSAVFRNPFGETKRTLQGNLNHNWGLRSKQKIIITNN